MGKRSRSSSNYTHKQSYNHRARESDDRRAAQLAHMTITRLRKAVDKQKKEMEYYIPEEKKKKCRVDPNYDLKGAARPASEFYRDPNFDYSEPEGVNLYEQYKDGKMWQHIEGQKFLGMLLELGIALHNIANKSKDAVKILKSIIEYDIDDNVRARHALLRCYLDEGDGLEARSLIEKYPEDNSPCFTFGLALLDHVAFFINKEEGSTLEKANESLAKAHEHNNYCIWAIALRPYFNECIELIEELIASIEGGEYCEGGILDALLFHEEDAAIWGETDGATEWVIDFLLSNSIKFSNPGTYLGADDDDAGNDDDENVIDDEEGNDGESECLKQSDSDVPNPTTRADDMKRKRDADSEEIDMDDDVEKKTEAELMYLNMYHTAVKMAASDSNDDNKSKAVARKLLHHLKTLPVFE